MPELREVFDMVTKQVEPDRDSWKEQERRQRRITRNRKIGGVVVVLAIAIAGGVLFLTQRNHGGTTQPANTSTASPSAPALSRNTTGAVVVGLDGSVLAAVPNLPFGAEYLSMAPDGNTIAFSALNAGATQVGTIGVDGSGLRWLTTTTLNSIEPAWSPDGSRIAFAAGFSTPQGQQIYVMSADGSGITKLTSDAGDDQWPAWSPDGTTIAYSNSGKQPLDESGFSATQELYAVPATGGTPTRLTHNDGWDDMPAYSPSGGLIAFARDGSIWTMSTDGSNAHSLAGHPGDHAYFNPRWSPDGGSIVFISYDGKRSATDSPLLSIHVLDPQTGFTMTRVPGEVEADINAPAWLPTSDALLVNRYGG